MPWVILFVIICIFGAGIDAIDRTQHGWKIVILLAYAVTAFVLFRKFQRSYWLAGYKRDRIAAAHERKRDREERKRKRQEALIAKQWEETDYVLPTADVFQTKLIELYKIVSTAPAYNIPLIRDDIVWQLTWVHRSIYQNSGVDKSRPPIDTKNTITKLSFAFVDGLMKFAEQIPPHLLAPDATNEKPFLFSQQTLQQLLNTEDITNALHPAYSTMVNQLREQTPDLIKEGLFFRTELAPPPLGEEPRSVRERIADATRFTDKPPNLDTLKRQWERDKKAYDKATEQRDSLFTPIEMACYNSPYWPYRSALVPTGSYIDPFPISDVLRFQGHWIIGTQGSGKTTLLREMYLHDLDKVAAGKASIVLMDSKEDLFKFAKLKRFAKGGDLEGKLTILTPEQAFPLALNPLDLGASPAHTIDLLEHVFASLRDTKQTSLQSTLFRSVFLLLIQVPHASFADFRKILVEGIRDYEQYLPKLHPEDQDFFIKPTSEGKTEFNSRVYSDTRGQILWRLRDLTTRSPMLRDLFNAPKTTVDIPYLINTANVIIIDNARSKLGPSGSEFFSRFFLALIRAAADQRSKMPNTEKMPTYVYMDEAHTVIANDENVEGIIAECRSQKIALIMAHQFWTQIENEKVRSALMNCAIRMANVDADAPQIAPRLRVEPEDVQLTEGHFLAFVRDKPPRKATVSFTPTGPLPMMDTDEEAEIVDRMRTKYAYQPSHLTELNEVYSPSPEAANPRPARVLNDDPKDFG